VSRLGHRIIRRQTLGLAGLAGAAYVTGCRASPDEQAAVAETQTPSCVLVPEVTEGPYFVDGKLKRSDIRANSSGGGARVGIPLALTIRIVEVGSGGRCSPYEGPAVDIWHCDAEGLYSGVDSDTDFLRGYQLTDANGAVTFRTIFPGWYRGRAIHIHLKVRTTTARPRHTSTRLTLLLGDDDRAGLRRRPILRQRHPRHLERGRRHLRRDRRDEPRADGWRSVRGLHGERDPGPVGAAGGGRRRGTPARKRLTHDRRGRRRLRARLELGERMRSVQARLVREGRTLTSSRLTGVRSGTRALSVSVGRGVEPGPALLVIVARDRGWAVRTIRRRVRIPQRLG
jgi:protocatechuate 3,4-dioxygenase beta subunit